MKENTYTIIHNDKIPLLIKAKIAGHECYAIVDTGSQITILNKDFANRCALLCKDNEPMDIANIGYLSNVQSEKCSTEITLSNNSDEATYPIDCMIMDIGEMKNVFKAKGYDEVELILGADWLKNASSIIDVKKKTMKLKPITNGET